MCQQLLDGEKVLTFVYILLAGDLFQDLSEVYSFLTTTTYAVDKNSLPFSNNSSSIYWYDSSLLFFGVLLMLKIKDFR